MFFAVVKTGLRRTFSPLTNPLLPSYYISWQNGLQLLTTSLRGFINGQIRFRNKKIMNQDQINSTGMHATVASYMDQNKPLWTANNAVSDVVTQLEANNGVITGKRDVQETSTEGQAALATQSKINLEEQIHEVADQIYAWATKNNDVVAQAQSHFTLSGLDSLDPGKLEQTGKDVSALATAKLASLTDYVAQADITSLDALTTDFGGKKKLLRAAVSTQAGQTKTLPQAIRDNQSLIRNQLDKLMTKFKKTNPTFYAGYHQARTTINRRSHHKVAPAPAPTPPAGAPTAPQN